MRRLPHALRGLAAAIVVVAVLAPAPPAAAAGGIEFGTPTAEATYGTGIAFSVPVSLQVVPERVELRLRFPDTLGPDIIDIPAPAGTATRSLQYNLDLTGGAAITPNTPIGVTWAVTAAGGETVTSTTITVRYADTSHAWQTLKGDFVIVHWYQGTQSFARQELSIGDQAIRETSALLGVTETDPVDFFIYGDQGSFSAALGPGARENVIGEAHADIRTMFGFITPDTLDQPQVAATVYHELVHLVFDTAVRNPYRFPPRWLNEGLAVYLSEGYGADRRSLVDQAVRTKTLIPLDALGGQFPGDATKAFLAYCEAVSALDYLVRTDGKGALVRLVQAYKDGLTDDEAFGKALGRDLASFQSGWLADLGATTPTRYGPQAAPAGPLPAGWSGPGQAGAPGSATAAPGATPMAPGTSGSPQPAGSGTDADTRGLVVLAIVVALVAVAIGLLIARRRSPAR